MKKLAIMAAMLLSACQQPHPIPVVPHSDAWNWHYEGKGKSKAQTWKDESACRYQSHLATAGLGDSSFGITQAFRIQIECMEARGYHRVKGQ